MTLVNQKQVLISQASRGDGVRSLLISQLGNLQHIHTLKALGQAEQAATGLQVAACRNIALAKLGDVLLRETLVGRQQDDTGEFFILPMLCGVVPVLQQVDVHQQRLAAAGGVLHAELVQVILVVRRHIGVIVPVAVETLNECIEIGEHPFTIAKKAVQVDLNKDQGQPLVVFPPNRAVAFFVDRLGMANNVLLIGQEHVPTDAKAREISRWIGIAEERAIAEMVVEEMQIILVQPFQAGIADGFGQLVKGANHFAIYFVFGERIDAEQAHQPLIEEQLVAELMRFGAA